MNNYLTAILIALSTANIQAQTFKSAPRLVVNIIIDQLRNDYLEAFSPLYSENGFKKLLQQGCYFSSVTYPFLPIDRASSIASIVTGTTPYYNGIVSESWLNKESLQPINCVDDIRYTGIKTEDKSSPHNIATSTIGDELKVSTSGEAKVFSVAPFKDAAILSAGHSADGAIWIDDKTGRWCGTSYYFKKTPNWFSAYSDLKSPSTFIANCKWTPTSTLSGNFSYFMNKSSQKPFAHVFTDVDKYLRYKTSALVNESVTDMALQCINANAMGVDGIADFMTVTYYAGKYNHLNVSNCQMELQDTYVRLDKDIALLLSTIERNIGKNNVLFVITSTGYTDDNTSDNEKYNIPTGTFYINRTCNLLNIYLSAIYGNGKYVETCFQNQIFLNHKIIEQKRISLNDILCRCHDFLIQNAGVKDVFTIESLNTSNNNYIEKLRGGYNNSICGDIVVEVSPGWQLLNENNHDNYISRFSIIQFPILFYGAGIESKTLTNPVSIDRIAPTISKSIRIRAPNACKAEPLF